MRAISIKFSTKDCQACPSLRLCTQSTRHVRRTVTIRPKEQYDALQARREFETTQGFKALYAALATLVKSERICNMWPLLQPSTLFV
jgi:transposase